MKREGTHYLFNLEEYVWEEHQTQCASDPPLDILILNDRIRYETYISDNTLDTNIRFRMILECVCSLERMFTSSEFLERMIYLLFDQTIINIDTLVFENKEKVIDSIWRFIYNDELEMRSIARGVKRLGLSLECVNYEDKDPFCDNTILELGFMIDPEITIRSDKWFDNIQSIYLLGLVMSRDGDMMTVESWSDAIDIIRERQLLRQTGWEIFHREDDKVVIWKPSMYKELRCKNSILYYPIHGYKIIGLSFPHAQMFGANMHDFLNRSPCIYMRMKENIVTHVGQSQYIGALHSRFSSCI